MRHVVVIPHRRQAAPSGLALDYALRRRHSLAHLYAKRSPQHGSWAGRDAGWAGHVPRGHVPPLAGPARRTAAGPRQGRLGLGPSRPEQAYLLTKNGAAVKRLLH